MSARIETQRETDPINLVLTDPHCGADRSVEVMTRMVIELP